MDVTVLRGLARNPALPPALLDRLVAIDDTSVRMSLAQRTDLSADHVRALLATRDGKVVGVLLRNGLVDENGLRALAADPSLRRSLVHVEDLPADVLDVLVASDAVVLVARYRTLPAGLAEQLSQHPDRRVRRALARNASTPPTVLARLTSEDFASFALAENPATPVEVLVQLAAHESFAVRRVTAQRSGLPRALYDQLAADEEEVVREAVAGNPAARADPATAPTPVSRRAEPRPLRADHPDLPLATILGLLADPLTAAEAAANPSLPVSVMLELLS